MRNDQIPEAERLRCIVCGERDVGSFMVAPDRFNRRRRLYHLVRCRTCSLVWIDSPPTAEEMREHYGSAYDECIAEVGETVVEGRWREPMLTLLAHKAEGDLLDIGCSSGGFLTALKGGPWRLFGIEISEPMAERAAALSGATIHVGDPETASFSPDAFDAVTMFHSLEHVYDPREVLERVYRWLRPGGVLIVYVPNIESGACRIFKSYWYGLELPRHLYHFSPSSLELLCHSIGFTNVSLTTHREPFIELSLRYLIDRCCNFTESNFTNIIDPKRPIFAWRLIRKILRLTLIPLMTILISFFGPGEIIHGVFRKPC